MHNAPPVAFPVGRFVWGSAILVLWGVCGALGLLAWQFHADVSPGLRWASWLGWGACFLLALGWAPRETLSDGRLFWNGESWFWDGADGQQQGVEVSVRVDLNSAMGLSIQRLDGSGQPQGLLAYAWVQARTMPSKWHGFRCAVYSRPKTDTHLTRL